MGLRAYDPSVKNLDGAYTSSVRMGTATNFTPTPATIGAGRQFVETLRPATPQPAPGVPFAKITTRLGSEI